MKSLALAVVVALSTIAIGAVAAPTMATPSPYTACLAAPTTAAKNWRVPTGTFIVKVSVTAAPSQLFALSRDVEFNGQDPKQL